MPFFSEHPKNKYMMSLCLRTGVVNFDHYIKGVFARFPRSEVTIFPWVINKYINTLFEIRYFTKLVSKGIFWLINILLKWGYNLYTPSRNFKDILCFVCKSSFPFSSVAVFPQSCTLSKTLLKDSTCFC